VKVRFPSWHTREEIEEMPSITELAEACWRGDVDLVHEHHPVVPTNSRQAEEIAPGVLYLKSLASVTAVDTGDGLVMLDTGGIFDRPIVHDRTRRWRPDTPLAAAVYSHHHVDHVFGTERFDAEAAERGWPRPVVYGHDALPGHFHRYQQTAGWNAAINTRQFGLPVGEAGWPTDFRLPDVTYQDRLTFRRGGCTFELHHARGETDDATWTWVPELRLLHPGDLFIWAVPNAGNPQKVQRYLSDWAEALRQMAALEPQLLVAGHGLPIFGVDRIRQALLDTAELLDSIEAQTLAVMNAGGSLDTALHEVTVPAHLADRPYLQPVYDHPQFLVRNVWRRYGGWWDGEPDTLLPAPRARQAEELVALAGGLERVLDRAASLADSGELALACHLAELAVLAKPTSAEAHHRRAEIYRSRAASETSSMARNILLHAARSSDAGVRDLLASPRRPDPSS
jgi:alkyl sulfatase BDS1-like metallo-beta-lactamase superfamily hydrolase